MTRSLIVSFVLHLAVIAFIVVGLPTLDRPEPAEAVLVPYRMVEIGERTSVGGGSDDPPAEPAQAAEAPVPRPAAADRAARVQAEAPPAPPDPVGAPVEPPRSEDPPPALAPADRAAAPPAPIATGDAPVPRASDAPSPERVVADQMATESEPDVTRPVDLSSAVSPSPTPDVEAAATAEPAPERPEASRAQPASPPETTVAEVDRSAPSPRPRPPSTEAPAPLPPSEVAEAPRDEGETEPETPEPRPEPEAETPSEQPPREDRFASMLDSLNLAEAPREEEEDEAAEPEPPEQSTDLAQMIRSLGASDASPGGMTGGALTMSEEDALRAQLERCWNPPAGAREAQDLAVEVRVRLGRGGEVLEATATDRGRMERDSFFRAAAESAERAVRICEPISLPPEKYDHWRNMIVNFDPKDMFG